MTGLPVPAQPWVFRWRSSKIMTCFNKMFNKDAAGDTCFLLKSGGEKHTVLLFTGIEKSGGIS